MKPEQIEEVLRERPPDEGAYARPVPTLLAPVMRSPMRSRRPNAMSWATGVIAVIAVLVLVSSRFGSIAPGASGSPPPSGAATVPASAGPSAVPWINERYVTPTAEPTPPISELALCPADAVEFLAGGWGGATGSAAGFADFINLSANPCRLEPPTAVVLYDATGAQIAFSPNPPVEAAIGLPAGALAWGPMVWDNWCQTTKPTLPVRVSITMLLEGDTAPAPTTLTAEVAGGSVDASLTPRCDTPSAPSRVGVVQPQLAQDSLGGYDRKACQPSDLRAFGNGWGGAAGSQYGGIVLYNASSFDCDLPSHPVVQVRDGDGQVVLSGTGDPSAVTAIPSGSTVILELITADWCTAPPKLPLRLDLELGTSSLQVSEPAGPSGAFPIDDCGAAPATPRAVFEVGSFVDPLAPTPLSEPPSDPGDFLALYTRISVSVPTSVSPGDVLRYTVTLTNQDPYGKPYNLAANCPSYIERLLPPGGPAVAERYLLNCEAAGVLAAGEGRTFDMEITVPTEATDGPATLIWQLGETGAGVKSQVTIDGARSTTP